MVGVMTFGQQATATDRDLWRRLAAEEVGTLLFETSAEAEGGKSYLFRRPLRTLTATDEASLADLMRELNQALADGFYVAGLLHYEAGYAFERVRNRPPVGQPVAWFGVYRERETAVFPPQSDASLLPEPLCVSMQTSLPEYMRQVAVAKHYIEQGDTYQVNLTTTMTASYNGETLPLYKSLSAQQPTPFSAMLHLPNDEMVMSFSPELFFSVDTNRTIQVRPMKGTARLSEPGTTEGAQAEWLASDDKNRAEHLMIVDLLRNDLGRICTAGSIHVDSLFDVERYRTLLQMTSAIRGSIREQTTLSDVFRALFPSGSMTGAPKPRTMEILAELEERSRGVYSGAIGFAAPDGSAVFNVAIRTIVLKEGVLQMGVGGGIVADSTPEQEHAECWLKSQFLLRASPPFALMETLLWDDGYRWLEAHLDRLETSAEQLNFCLNRKAVREQILRFGADLSGRQRVRLLLERSGNVRFELREAQVWNPPLKVRLSPERTSSKNSFLRHKTTFRPVYDASLAEAHRLGFDEALFTNERDELTEGCITSMLLLLGGTWQTPALQSGVLPGVARSLLLERAAIKEAVLTLNDLQRAEAVALCNGVRGVSAVASITLRDGTVLPLNTAVTLPQLP